MLTGRIGTAKDTSPAPKVPEQVPSLCNYFKARQILLVLLPQEREPLRDHRRAWPLRTLGDIRRLKFVVLHKRLTALFRKIPDHCTAPVDRGVQFVEPCRKFCRLSDAVEFRLKLAKHSLDDFLPSATQLLLFLRRGNHSKHGVTLAREQGLESRDLLGISL